MNFDNLPSYPAPGDETCPPHRAADPSVRSDWEKLGLGIVVLVVSVVAAAGLFWLLLVLFGNSF